MNLMKRLTCGLLLSVLFAWGCGGAVSEKGPASPRELTPEEKAQRDKGMKDYFKKMKKTPPKTM
jgi:hypothetical protein